MNFLSYTEAIEYLYNKAPMFSRIGKAAYKANLDNTIQLDHYFNHPHKKFKSIHIAGTNGKGSVAHSITAILMDSGYKTGLYTSPHIKDFRERIKINGLNIREDYIIDFLNKHYNIIEKVQPSFFEITTLLAFKYFADEQVDIAVIETGLGGRLDSTNIITPILSIITNIGWDHADLLGNTLEKIASEKAGIIKKNVPVIIGTYQKEIEEIFLNKAKAEESEILFADNIYKVEDFFLTQNNLLQVQVKKENKTILPGLKYQLIGFYQTYNIPAILCAVDFLRDFGYDIKENNIYRAFKQVVDLTQFRGRWQIIGQKPLIIADIGHNKPALEQNVLQLNRINKDNLYMVLGFMNDKDLNAIFPILPKEAHYIFCEAPIPRSIKANELKNFATQFGLNSEYEPLPMLALQKAKSYAKHNDLIYVGGSTYIVSEIL